MTSNRFDVLSVEGDEMAEFSERIKRAVEAEGEIKEIDVIEEENYDEEISKVLTETICKVCEISADNMMSNIKNTEEMGENSEMDKIMDMFKFIRRSTSSRLRFCKYYEKEKFPVEVLRMLHDDILSSVCDDKVVSNNDYVEEKSVPNWIKYSVPEISDDKSLGFSGIWWQESSLNLYSIVNNEVACNRLDDCEYRVVNIDEIRLELERKQFGYVEGRVDTVDIFNASNMTNEHWAGLMMSRFVRRVTRFDQSKESLNVRRSGSNSSSPTDFFFFSNFKVPVAVNYSKLYIDTFGSTGNINYKRCFKKMNIAQLLHRYTIICKKILTNNVINYCESSKARKLKSTMNTVVFGFHVTGSMCIMIEQGSRDCIKMIVNDDGDLASIVIKFKCLSLNVSSRISIVDLEVVGEMSLGQGSIISIMTSLRSSPGRFNASLDEIMMVQDAAWLPIIEENMMLMMDDQGDYAIANAADNLPLMALAGILPAGEITDVIKELWQVSVEAIINSINNSMSCLKDLIKRRRLVDCITICASLCCDNDNEDDSRNILMMFMMYGVSDEDDVKSILEHEIEERENNQKTAKWFKEAGGAEHLLWMNSILYDNENMCKVGYRFFPLVLIYNFFRTSKCRVNVIKMSTWLVNAINVFVDMTVEDKNLSNICKKIGLALEEDEFDSIKESMTTSLKIARLITIIKRKLEEIGDVNRLGTMSVVEAIAATKVFIRMATKKPKEVNEEEVNVGGFEFVINKVHDSIVKNVELGLLSEFEAEGLTNELSKSTEDFNEETHRIIIDDNKIVRSIMAFSDRLVDSDDEELNRWSDVGTKVDSMVEEEVRNEARRLANESNSTVRVVRLLNESIVKKRMDINDASELLRHTFSVSDKTIMGSKGRDKIVVDTSIRVTNGGTVRELGVSARDEELLRLTYVEQEYNNGMSNIGAVRVASLTILEGVVFNIGMSFDFDYNKLVDKYVRLSRGSIDLSRFGNNMIDRNNENAIITSGYNRLMLSYKQNYDNYKKRIREIIKINEVEVDLSKYRRTRFILAMFSSPGKVIRLLVEVFRYTTDHFWDLVSLLYDQLEELHDSLINVEDIRMNFARRQLVNLVMYLKALTASSVIAYKISSLTFVQKTTSAGLMIESGGMFLGQIVRKYVNKTLTIIDLGYNYELVSCLKTSDLNTEDKMNCLIQSGYEINETNMIWLLDNAVSLDGSSSSGKSEKDSRSFKQRMNDIRNRTLLNIGKSSRKMSDVYCKIKEVIKNTYNKMITKIAKVIYIEAIINASHKMTNWFSNITMLISNIIKKHVMHKSVIVIKILHNKLTDIINKIIKAFRKEGIVEESRIDDETKDKESSSGSENGDDKDDDDSDGDESNKKCDNDNSEDSDNDDNDNRKSRTDKNGKLNEEDHIIIETVQNNILDILTKNKINVTKTGKLADMVTNTIMNRVIDYIGVIRNKGECKIKMRYDDMGELEMSSDEYLSKGSREKIKFIEENRNREDREEDKEVCDKIYENFWVTNSGCLVLHGKYNKEMIRNLGEESFAAYDCDDCTILKISSDSEIMIDEVIKSIVGITKKDIKADQSATSGYVSFPTNNKKTISGRVSIVKNFSTGEEEIITAKHLISYGMKNSYEKNIDACISLGICGLDSELVNNPQLAEKNMNVNHKIKDQDLVGCIIAKEKIKCGSKRLVMVLTDSKNWQGMSGCPVVSNSGALIGYCLMQILSNDDYEVIKGRSLIIAVKPEAVGIDIICVSNIKTSVCQRCYDILMVDEITRINKGKGLVDCEIIDSENDEGISVEAYEKKRTDRGWLDAIIRRMGLKQNIKECGELMKCGALEEVLKLNNYKLSENKSISYDNIISMIMQMNRLAATGVMNKETLNVMNYIKESLLGEEKIVLVGCSNSINLSISILLTAMNVPFSRLKNLRELRAETNNNSKDGLISVMWAEDVIADSLLIDKISTPTRINIDKIVIYCDNVEHSKKISIQVARLVSVFSNENSICVVDSRDNQFSSNKEEECKGLYLATGFQKNFQNVGLMHELEVDSSLIRLSLTKDGERIGEDAKITIAVITDCHSHYSQQYIKNKISDQMCVNKNKIIVCHFSAISVSSIWEVIRTCYYLVIHTGTTTSGLENVVVNCLVDYKLSELSRKLISDSHKILEITVMRNTILSDVTIHRKEGKLDENVKTNDGMIFQVNYSSKTKSVDLNINDIIRRIDNIKIKGLTLMKIDERLHNVLEEIENSGSIAILKVTKEDIIDKEAIERFNESKELSSGFVSRMNKIKSKIKRNIRTAKLKTIEIITRLSIKIDYLLKNGLDWIKGKIIRMRRKLVFGCKRIINKIFSRKDTSKFKPLGRSFEEQKTKVDIIKDILGIIIRSIGAGVTISGLKLRNQGSASKSISLVFGGLSWMAIEIVGLMTHDIVSSLFKLIGNINLVCALGCKLIYLITEKKISLFIGNIVITIPSDRCLADINKLTEKVKNMSKKIISEIKGKADIKVVTTGAIIANNNIISMMNLFNVSELINKLSMVARKIAVRFKLSEVISSLWNNIKKRNDYDDKPTGRLKAIPCYKLETTISIILLIGGAATVSTMIGNRRAQKDVEMIGVISERKQTADVINIYINDRETYCLIARIINLIGSLVCLFNGNMAIKWVGGIALMLSVVDVATEKKSSLGTTYSLSNCINRAIYSPNMISSAISGISAWWSLDDYGSLIVNSIIITGKRNKRDDNNGKKLETDNCKQNWLARGSDWLIKQQTSEMRANIILTDLTRDGFECYEEARKVMGIQNVSKIKSFKNVWDIDYKSGEKLIDLKAAARREVTYFGEEDENMIVKLKNITNNQCRYLGRSRKIGREEQLDEIRYEDKQKSMLALDDRLWDQIVDEEINNKYAPAGDSRASVLLAIAERNDMEARFDIDKTVMEDCVKSSLIVIDKFYFENTVININTESLDAITIIRSINEKSTSGIITRCRSGYEITAGYLPYNMSRCEIYKEMVNVGCAPEDSSIINVFAKRRIEKKKISRLTGEECVITRTIQANEIENKISNIELFSVMDKVLKLNRCSNLMAIGLNYFSEYSRDDLATIVTGINKQKREKVVRISLDHSSFDGSQRVWSIELVKQIRKICLKESTKDKKTYKRISEYLDKSYDQLKIRMMISSKGDIFGVTGQQMSGHATTTSDNSIKSLIYALVVKERLIKDGMYIIDNTIRTQGDDTRFNMIVGQYEDNNKIKEKISKYMSDLGQVTKSEKIKITEWFEKCDFLSHYCEMKWFILTDNKNKVKWLQQAYCPIRDKEDLISMIAAVLKTSDKKKKTKKDISLLAAKSMSFLTMFATDGVMASLFGVLIRLCFNVLKGMKMCNERMDIRSMKLPWFVQQSSIEGEFKMKIEELLMMHGVGNELCYGEKWVIKNSEENKRIVNKIGILIDNFVKVFYKMPQEDLRNSRRYFKYLKTKQDKKIYTIKIDYFKSLLETESKDLVLNIAKENVGYKPYVDLKSQINEKFGSIKDLSKFEYSVIKGYDCDEEECLKYIKHMILKDNKGKIKVEDEYIEGLSEEGIFMTIGTRKVVSTDDSVRCCVLNNVIESRILKIKPWNVIILNKNREIKENMYVKSIIFSSKENKKYLDNDMIDVLYKVDELRFSIHNENSDERRLSRCLNREIKAKKCYRHITILGDKEIKIMVRKGSKIVKI